MASISLRRLRFLWGRLTVLDRTALVIIVLNLIVSAVRWAGAEPPLGGFLRFLLYLALLYALVRLIAWSRGRLLWSLRNRLILAYLFIAVVPVVLLLVMAALAGYILYFQLGAYLIYADVQKQVDRVAAVGDAVLAAVRAAPSAASSASLSPEVTPILDAARAALPGLQVELNTGQEILRRAGGASATRFAGLVQSGNKVSLRAVVSRAGSNPPLLVSVSVPVTSDWLESIAPEVGPMQLGVTRPATPAEAASALAIGNRRVIIVREDSISTKRRAADPPASRFDYAINGFAKLDALRMDGGEASSPILVRFFSARPSRLNARLFSSLGELGGNLISVLAGVGIVFLLLELAALWAGVALTRTITRAVSDLYSATQFVQSGDLSHRIRIERRDQLGALGESFNSMTGSISTLIEEQRQRQRLENELAIAREVQDQLFPQTIPTLPGIEVNAVCRAARMVSGDYYDFLPLGPTRMGMALADISGKGISAALLMASLQAALRSQVQLDGAGGGLGTADLVTRINLHLFRNTSNDRYATFFYAVYDSATRMLYYTNAGHLPPFCISGEKVTKLEAGGTVVGLFDDCAYEQGSLRIEPGTLLIAFSDGLIEPENVYGEQFGSRRLLDVALRSRSAAPHAMAENLIHAAEEWAGTAEQSDDMTVLVARLT